MRRRGVRGTREWWENFGTVAGTVLVAAIIAVAGYYGWSPEPAPDAHTLCPGSGPTGHVVLLIDTTDPLNFTQKRAFLQRVDELLQKDVRAGELLSVFIVGESYRDNAEPVELCHPGDGTGKNPITNTVERLDSRFRQKFKEPMVALSESRLTGEAAKASPILEMLQMIAINGFRKHDVRGERRLIIVSDMIHNTREFSLYGTSAPNYETFSKTPYAAKVKTDLKGVAVELDYLMNRPELQTRRQVLFWEELFSAYGARVTRVKPLEG